MYTLKLDTEPTPSCIQLLQLPAHTSLLESSACRATWVLTSLQNARQGTSPPLKVEIDVKIQDMLERVVSHPPPRSLHAGQLLGSCCRRNKQCRFF